MNIIKSVKKMRVVSQECRKAGKKICFIPTMGALHCGHISLIRNAKKDKGFLVVSIFVNSLQFGVNEDYKKYPRNLKKDIQLLINEKVDLLFFPNEKQMYFPNFSVCVEETDISQFLCGKLRPGHFKGVCTVLVKLFNIICPDIAYFGQKDYQQAQVVKRLVRDLMFPIRIKVLPTIREKNNLAMSSRNAYLTSQGRQESVCVYKALRLAKQLIDLGARNPSIILSKVKNFILKNYSAKIDYLKIVDPERLSDMKIISGRVLVVIAVYICNVRLIDNLIIKVSNKQRGDYGAGE